MLDLAFFFLLLSFFLFSLSPPNPYTLFAFVHDYDDCEYLCGCDSLRDI